MKTATLRQASRSLRPLAAFFALTAALCASACKPVIVGGGGQGGGAGGGSATGGGTTGAVNAIAVPYVLLDHPSPPDGSSGTSGAGGSFGVDPGTLYVKIGNFGQTCTGDGPPFCSTGALSWQVSVGIPPALQVPGVIQLSDPTLLSYSSENGPNSGTPGDCFGGGGSFIEGTLEIVSIDAGTIVVILAGTSQGGLGDFDADGEYTAPICPTGV
jgi:hypothetical protein